MPNISLGRSHLTNSTHFTSATISTGTSDAVNKYMVMQQPEVVAAIASNYTPGTVCLVQPHKQRLRFESDGTMSNVEIGDETTVIHSSNGDDPDGTIGSKKSAIYKPPPIATHDSTSAVYLHHLPPFNHHPNSMYIPPAETVESNNETPAPENLSKQGNRPLGRTQSAPLPLGHPNLSAPMSITQTHFENSEVR